MRQDVQVITVGVADLETSRSFYTDGLGWRSVLQLDDIVYYQVGYGLLFAIYAIRDFAADIGAPISLDSSFSLGRMVSSSRQVDEAVEIARSAGARILKDPQDAPYGGYHAYFADPDGHRWEVAYGRGISVAEDGTVSFETAGLSA